jgi:hypothetical protein
VLPVAFLFAILWATYIVPSLWLSLIGAFGSSIQAPLMAVFPGLMRSTILLVWLMLVIYPVSSALQEIKIGQWEILLSHDVKTRSIMFGTFAAKIPVYGLVTLLISPILISPFAIVFQVGLVGQLIMYLTIFFFAISTLWLSNFLTTAVQARLGDSPRGNDLAKALAWILTIILVVPIYAIIFFAGDVSSFLGSGVFLIFPFTWGADLITWTVISLNGVGLSQLIINDFQSVLGLSWPVDLLLLSAFSLALVGLAFASAGRLFRIGAGPRIEKIVTATRDGPFMRLIRRVSPGSSGILLTGTLKDFMRKAQNVSQLAYLVILSIIYTLFFNAAFKSVSSSGIDPTIELYITASILGMIVSILAGMSFGGIGFLDNKDELWTIQTAPKGVSKFVRARVMEALLMSLIIATIPALVLFLVLNYSLAYTFVIWVYMYVALAGGAMVGIGVSANNPMYDDTQSGAFKSNRIITALIVIACAYGWFFFVVIRYEVWTYGLLIALLITIAPLLIVAVLTGYVGTKRLSRPMR